MSRDKDGTGLSSNGELILTQK